MATTTATNSNQASPSPFPASMLAGFQSRNFQPNNQTSASPSSTPISLTSTSSNGFLNGSVFPPANIAQSPQQQSPQMQNMFNPNYYSALMQNQIMQQFMKQYMSAVGLNDSTAGNSDSRSPSTIASPSFTQQHQKKLLLDAEGNIACPICEQKIGPDSWKAHVELERSNLVKTIESLKENKRPSQLLSASSSLDLDNSITVSEPRKKREFELSRIRANQQKRLSMKGSLLSSSLTLQNNHLQHKCGQNAKFQLNQNAKFSIGSLCETPISPPRAQSGMSFRDLNDGDRNFCKSCERAHEFLIISVGLEPRCMDCYRKYRRQVGALPLTITESPTDNSTQPLIVHRNGSHTTSSASPSNQGAACSNSGGSLHEEEDFGANLDTPAKRPRLDFLMGN